MVDAGIATGHNDKGFDLLQVGVVLAPGERLDAMADTLAERLPTEVIDVRLIQVARLPRAATGKLQRHILANELGNRR